MSQNSQAAESDQQQPGSKAWISIKTVGLPRCQEREQHPKAASQASTHDLPRKAAREKGKDQSGQRRGNRRRKNLTSQQGEGDQRQEAHDDGNDSQALLRADASTVRIGSSRVKPQRWIGVRD